MTREEAIKRIQEHMRVHAEKEPRAIYITEALQMAIKALEQEPKTGRWIKDSLWTKPYCSECGKSCIGVHGFDCITTDFCPNCGAKMESEDKE